MCHHHCKGVAENSCSDQCCNCTPVYNYDEEENRMKHMFLLTDHHMLNLALFIHQIHFPMNMDHETSCALNYLYG